MRKAFIAFGLPALKTNEFGIATPVVLYRADTGAEGRTPATCVALSSVSARR